MKRLLFLLCIFLLLPAQAEFGKGPLDFQSYPVGANVADFDDAPEPTIGIWWNPDGPDEVYFKTLLGTGIATFDSRDGVTWVNSNNQWDGLTNLAFLDPILHTDEVTGRTWGGQFSFPNPCTTLAMGYKDPEDTTWTPMAVVCQTSGGDHETIGSGPWAEPKPAGATYDRAVYYCAQYLGTNCARSDDGGDIWLPQGNLPCGGLHGHVRVSPEGYVAVPDETCSGATGFSFSTNNGASFSTRNNRDIPSGEGSDPSISFSRELHPSTGKSVTYLGHTTQGKALVGVSYDFGSTWERTVDAASFYEGPSGERITRTVFPDIQAGDADRAGFSFLGATDQGPANGFLCDDAGQEQVVWHLYVAMTYDEGRTWSVSKASQHPIQVGGVYMGGFGVSGDDSCRNLLDFNDSDIDSEGRYYVGLADGCVGACGEGSPASTSRADDALLFRQNGGRGVFAAFDKVAPPASTSSTSSQAELPVTVGLDIAQQGAYTVGPHEFTGTLSRNIAASDNDAGRIVLMDGTTPLSQDRVTATVEGAEWSLATELTAGEHTYQFVYTEHGTELVREERTFFVETPPTEAPVDPVLQLTLLTESPEVGKKSEYRLEVIGSVPAESQWTIQTGTGATTTGTADELPVIVGLNEVSAGTKTATATLTLESGVLTDTVTYRVSGTEETNSTPAALPILLVGLVLLAARRRA